MCFGEMITRRGFLTTAVATAAAVAVDGGTALPVLAEDDEVDRDDKGPGAAGVKFAWFGTNGWEITFDNRTILVDPWFGRFDTGFFAGRFNPNVPLPPPREALIAQHVTRADQILIGHGLWDHMADIPFIAKNTGAMVIGSETHANVLRATGQVREVKTVQGQGRRVHAVRRLHD